MPKATGEPRTDSELRCFCHRQARSLVHTSHGRTQRVGREILPMSVNGVLSPYITDQRVVPTDKCLELPKSRGSCGLSVLSAWQTRP